MRKIGILAVAFVMFEFSFDTYFSGLVNSHPHIAFGILIVWIWSLSLIVGLITDLVDLKKLEYVTVAGLAFSMILYSFVSITVINPGNIGSDGTYFLKESAEMTLSGENPYNHYFEEKPSAYYFTPTFEGDIVSKLLYPSLSFLSYIPFILLEVDIRILGPLMLGLLIFILYRLSPDKFGVIPLLSISVSRYFLTEVTLNNDLLWVNLIIGSIIFFEYRHKLSALLFGLASAVRPTPWLIAPFILLRYYKQDELDSKGIDYVLYSIGSFAAVNLPFYIWNPVAWTEAVFNLPLKSLGVGAREMILGQGLALLSYTGIANLSPRFYTVASLGALAVLFAAYLLYFERLKHVFWIFPMFVFFFNYRGLVKYYMVFMPIAAVILIKLYYVKEGDLDRFREKAGF